MKTAALIVCLLLAAATLAGCDISWGGDSDGNDPAAVIGNDRIESLLVGIITVVDVNHFEIETDDGLTLDADLPEGVTVNIDDLVEVTLTLTGSDANNDWTLTDVTFSRVVI